MSKNNIRSFRYSDEVAAILEGQPGKSLNDKFEALVVWKALEKASLESEIVTLRQKKQEARQELRQVQEVLASLEKIRSALVPLETVASMIDVTQIAENGVSEVPETPQMVLQKQRRRVTRKEAKGPRHFRAARQTRPPIGM